MNYDRQLTAYEISGLVNDMYWILPTIDLYIVASCKGVPVFNDIFGEEGRGVVTGLASNMLTQKSKSLIYFLCIRWRPVVVRVAFMPRK